MTTIADGDGDDINLAIPDYNKAELLREYGQPIQVYIGTFLAVLRFPQPQTQRRDLQTHVQMVSSFLRGS